MHQFMDAADVRPAWELMQRGETSADPRVRATQERLAACHYAMAHPEDGTLVPACVQHCVLDPAENRELRTLLPLPTAGQRVIAGLRLLRAPAGQAAGPSGGGTRAGSVPVPRRGTAA